MEAERGDATTNPRHELLPSRNYWRRVPYVKSTRKPGGNLNAVQWSSGKPADYFVLTEIMPFDIFIVGWIRREHFLCEANLQDRGNGLFYSVDRSQLEPFNVKYKENT